MYLSCMVSVVPGKARFHSSLSMNVRLTRIRVGTWLSVLISTFVLKSHFPRFSEVFFVDATSVESIEADLRNIAIAKGIGDSPTDALRWLCMHKEEWLLFIDNADDPSLNLSDYFPQCSHGNIIVTSRNSETRVHASNPRCNAKVSSLSPENAIDLLLEVSGVGEEQSEETRKLATTIAEVF
jgi:hypothetical protein